MLREATAVEEREFMRGRRMGDPEITEKDIFALDDILKAKAPSSSCPWCGEDLRYKERGNSYAIWCVDQESCRLGSVLRGI